MWRVLFQPTVCSENLTDYENYLRHFAVIGAVLVLVLYLFGFFVQQLSGIQTVGYPDIKNLSNPNSHALQRFNRLVQKNTSLDDFPVIDVLARIANVTSYAPRNYGDAPCMQIHRDAN